MGKEYRKRKHQQARREAREKGITLLSPSSKGLTSHAKTRLCQRFPTAVLPSSVKLKRMIKKGEVAVRRGKGKSKIIRLGDNRVLVLNRKMTKVITAYIS